MASHAAPYNHFVQAPGPVYPHVDPGQVATNPTIHRPDGADKYRGGLYGNEHVTNVSNAEDSDILAPEPQRVTDAMSWTEEDGNLNLSGPTSVPDGYTNGVNLGPENEWNHYHFEGAQNDDWSHAFTAEETHVVSSEHPLNCSWQMTHLLGHCFNYSRIS